MDAKEFSAKTVEQAIEAGLNELGLTREQADVEILEEKTGFLKKAKVRISKKKTEGERAQEFLEGLLEKMGVTAVVERKENETETELIVNTTESGTVIGKRGEALDAMQYLSSMVANGENADFRRIVVDCENYREKRVEILQAMADKLAKKAEETGRRVQMDPMNPYERRIIHSQLQQNPNVTTESRGEDPNRFVVIYPKNRKFNGDRPSGDRGGFNRPYNRENRDGRDNGGNRDRRDDRGGARGNFNRDRNAGGGRRDDGRPFNRDRDSKPPRGEFGYGTYLGKAQSPATPPAEEKKDEE